MSRCLKSLIFVLPVLMACATSPLGRKQLLILPESQVAQMGAASFQEIKTQIPTEQGTPVASYVQCVAMAVADKAKDAVDVEKWDVEVFKDPSANAFALPGGKIGVNTGLLKVARNDSQLAAVIGHEVGHVIARHGNERVSQQFAVGGAQMAVSALTKGHPQHGLLMGALGVGAQFGVLLPYSRTQETESDLLGVRLMARAGFDPRESVQLWKNMMKAAGKGPPEFLSTHPAPENRIVTLQDNMEESMRLYSEAKEDGVTPKCERPAGA